MIIAVCKNMQKQLECEISSYITAIEKHMLGNSTAEGDSLSPRPLSSSLSMQSPSCKTKKLELDQLAAQAAKLVRTAIEGFQDFIMSTYPSFVLPTATFKS